MGVAPLRRFTLPLLLVSALLLTMPSAEAIPCDVPTPAYPDLKTALASGCLTINFIGDVTDTQQAWAVDPGGDVIIEGNGYTWKSTANDRKLYISNVPGSIRVVIRNLKINFTAPAPQEDMLFVGTINLTVRNIYVEYVDSPVWLRFQPSLGIQSMDVKNVTGVMRGVENLQIFMELSTWGDVDRVVIEDVEVHNVFMAIQLSIRRDANEIVIRDVRGDGGINIINLRDIDGRPTYILIRDVNLWGSGWSFGIIPLSSILNVDLIDLNFDGDGWWPSLRFYYSETNLTIRNLRVVLPSVRTRALSIQTGFSLSARLNATLDNIYLSGPLEGFEINVLNGGVLGLKARNIVLENTHYVGRIYALSTGSYLDAEINDLLAGDVRDGGLEAVASLGGIIRLALNNVVINVTGDPAWYSLRLYSQPGLPTDLTHIFVEGNGVFLYGENVISHLNVVGLDPRPVERVNGTFRNSLIGRFIFTGAVEVNMTESVYWEVGSILGGTSSSYSVWTLGVKAVSKTFGTPVPNYQFKILVDGAEVATITTGPTGVAYYTFSYWYDPGNPMTSRIDILDPESGDIYNMQSDLGYTTTLPSWYEVVEIEVEAIYLVVDGFTGGMGRARLVIGSGMSWISIMHSGAVMNIPIRIHQIVPLQTIVYIPASILYQGVWVETTIYVYAEKRLVWIPGPIKFVGWF